MKKMRKYLAALMVLALFVGMLPLTSTAASAAESDHVVANDDPYPEGITLDLFDYWLDDQEASDQSNPAGWQDLGINKGETLKFGAGMDKIDGVAAYNKWTNSAEPYNGIVEKTLGSDGYPQLDQNTTGSSGSLAYLFSGSAHDGKASYTNVGGLLQQDDEGYFYYDSKKNFAAFDTSTDRFTLYDTWGVQTGGQSPDGQFFPFNTGEEVFETQGDSLVQKDGLTSTDASINHYFGMHMTTRFQQPKNGLSPSDDKTPVTYAFSGDDDVWIYIDDVLVADLGGIHNAASVEINFATGDIVVYEDKDDDGTYDAGTDTLYTQTTLKAVFTDAGVAGDYEWNGNTFADDSYHTMDFFYLERGNTDSNMNLKFNLVTTPESTLEKVDQDGEPVPGATYALYKTDASYTVSEGATPLATGTTDDSGTFTFYNNDGTVLALSTLEVGTHYVLREEDVPDGYRSAGDIHLYVRGSKGDSDARILLSDNEWSSGAYASAKVRVIANTSATGDQRLVTDIDGDTHDINADGARVIAAVFNDDSGVTYGASVADDKAVYGDPLTGWQTTEGTGIAALQEIAADMAASDSEEGVSGLYEFGFDSANRFVVDIENLPDDITYYAWMKEAGQATYTGAYFYTTADSYDEMNEENTFQLKAEDFQRDFAVTLYAPNINNRLLVQKTNEDGTQALDGATFALYEEGDLTIADDGGWTVDGDAEPVQTVTTEQAYKLSETQTVPGAGAMTDIPLGTYYLVEKAAPAGYDLNPQAIKVVVDNDGVHVDAGTAEDDVTVILGVGKIVKSMVQFAVDDGIDASLHDITAILQTSEDYNENTQWTDTDSMTLSYDEDNAVLEYGPASTGGETILSYDSGWGRLNITQTDHATTANGSPKQDLFGQSLNNLFSGTTLVTVGDTLKDPGTVTTTADQRFSITKEVTDGDWPDGAEFTFTIEAANGAPLPQKDGADQTSLTITQPEDGSNTATASFGDITFTDAGEYTYTVAEEQGDVDGMTYDDHKLTVTVTVDKNEEGKLVITDIVYDSAVDADDETAAKTFTNTITQSSGGGGGWIPGGSGNEDTPDLNTEDHFSYIVGYPEDYRTGEATDDESLWPVKPQGNITRAEVATIFYRLLTDDARTEHWTRSNDYTDVTADSWYNTPVSTLSAMGILTGYEDGSFRPDEPITRAEFAAIAVRFFENNDVSYTTGTFTDIEGSEWFADAVAAAKDHEIIGGYPDGSFQPNKAITRAEACAIVNRTVDRIPDKDHLLSEDEMRTWPDNSDTDAWYYADIQEATSGHEYTWVLDDNDDPLYEQWTGDLAEVDWEQVEIDQEEKHGLR